jgi:hypothetical protein
MLRTIAQLWFYWWIFMCQTKKILQQPHSRPWMSKLKTLGNALNLVHIHRGRACCFSVVLNSPRIRKHAQPLPPISSQQSDPEIHLKKHIKCTSKIIPKRNAPNPLFSYQAYQKNINIARWEPRRRTWGIQTCPLGNAILKIIQLFHIHNNVESRELTNIAKKKSYNENLSITMLSQESSQILGTIAVSVIHLVTQPKCLGCNQGNYPSVTGIKGHPDGRS